ncbi:MAG: glycosyltransferase [Bacteroidota bacterium]
MKIAIVIPTHYRLNLLLKLIESLQLSASKVNDLELYYIVVFDEREEENSLKLKSKYSFIHTVIGNGNWWFTKSVNEGIKYGYRFGPDCFLTINDDLEVAEDYLKNLVLSSTHFPQSFIGSVSADIENRRKILFSGIKKKIWLLLKNVSYNNLTEDIIIQEPVKVRKSVVLPARGLLLPKTLLDDIGLFDERFPQYGSDDEIVLRARKKGYTSYICLDALLYSHWKETGYGDLRLNPSIGEVIKGMFNEYSILHLRKNSRLVAMYAHPVIVPITLVLNVVIILRRWLINKMYNLKFRFVPVK